jgi:hypothetical protein
MPGSGGGMSDAAMTCSKCGADVSKAKRLKDSKGRYFCEGCAAALREKAAAKLGVPVAGGGGGCEAAATPKTAGLADDGTIPLADAPMPERVGSPSGQMELCPDCSTPLGSGPICASCGYNRITGVAIGAQGAGTPPPAGTKPLPSARKKPRKSRTCLKCGYDLTGLKSPRCPECGTVNSAFARAKAEEKQTLKTMYLKPLIAAVVGVLLACGVHALLHAPVTFYLFYYAATLPVVFFVYMACSIWFIGFDEPLGVTFVRLAATVAVADVFFAGIDAIPFIGWYAWPFEAIIYTGLLMHFMELDFEDARVVAIITFVAHLALWFAAAWVWETYL